MPLEKTDKFFRQAKVLVNTSVAEGWPNTFLQAGAAGTPVLSFQVNPDNYLTKFNCGFIGQNQFKQILNNPRQLKTRGQNHLNYVKRYHGLANLKLLKQILYRL